LSVILPSPHADHRSRHRQPGVRPGFDRFVWKRSTHPHHVLGDVCIGAKFVGKTLLWLLRHHATRFRVFTDLSPTFHLGDDKVWKSPDLADYQA